ncbi:MAG: macro domain-containing protein [Anaerolineaceae bacterium]|nr:macro domain-containing protein [Anaerolineaceae bacterium]
MSKLLACVILAGDRRLELVRGDLTKERVDVIVNAANQWLMHGGGVAGAIAKNGGSIIQEESNDWVAGHGPITHMQPAYTRAGKLPCRYVIHSVGTVWGEGGEKEKLKQAINSALCMAIRLEMRTLALPPISTGIFGYPKEMAAPIFYSTIQAFWLVNPDCCLNLIRITIIDEPTSNVFLNALIQWKKELG